MSLTNNHPLSSATTSLSRSAKSGKEGHPGKAKEMGSEDSLDSVKQWKTKQKVHHDRLEVRKQSLLELVEKTVSHAHALDILESVYLSSANSSSLPASAVEIIRKLRPMVARIRKVNNRVKDIMVSVLKEEGIGYGQSMGKRRSEGDVFETEAEREQEERAHMEVMGEEFEERLDRAVSKISVAMLAEEKGFRKYTKLCVTGLNANKVFSGVSNGDRERFEARCQAQMDSREHYDLSALLETSTLGLTSVSKRRLHFQDFLHAPYQRIPGLVLLLQRVQDSFKGLPIKVGDDLDATSRAYVDVGRLREMIARVGTTTDSARGVKMKEEATETLISRMDAHSEVTPEVLRSLGTCRLIGSLNVLYQHIEPLPKQATVKHLAAFLFDGYLILAKVKKNQKVYEPRHFFPLSMFVMYGVTTGPISPSIRLESGRFSYFLGALSAEEQAIWHDALDVARDKHVSPYAVPTSLPVSITQAIQEGWIEDAWKSSADITKPISSPQQTPALSRRASMGATKSLDLERITPVTRAKRRSPEKRHTMTGLPTKSLNPDDILSALKTVDAKSKNDSEPSTPVKSPVRTTFTAMTPDRNKELTQTLKQPQKSMIDNVMHGLEGIFDNQCAQIRAGETIRKSQSMGASSRRKSTTQLVGFKDSIGATVFTGAVTESVIPKREPTLGHVKGKPSLPDDWQPGETSELPPAVADSDEEEDEDEQEEESGGTSRPISEFGASTSRQPLPRNGSSTSLFGVPSSKSSFLFMSASNDDSRNSLRMRTKRDKTRKGAALAENEIAKEKEKDPVGHARKKSEPTRRKISSKEGMAHYTHIREKSQPASPMLSPAHEQPSFEISLRHEDEQAVYDSGSTTAPAEETVEEMAEGEDGVLLTAPGLKRRSFSYDSTPIARRPGPSRRITPPEYSIPEPHGPAPVQPFGASFGGFFDRSRRDSDRSRKDSRTSAESAAPGGLSRRSSFVSVKSSLKRSLSGISLLSTRKSPNIEVPGIGIDDGTGSSAQSTPGTEFSPMSPITGLYGAEDDYGRDALEMKRVAPTRQKSFKNLYGLGFSSMKPERG
ncbi:hypothetical protein I350_07017 [Cryptococcus amylolentus CBS 6273]|nr:hypothetical protein I350_07017 [Cryptococcus amylolentus CBS 6273]